jgi:hypothetical protein
MGDKRPSDYSDDHGSRQQEPQFLRLKATVARQGWDKGRLHAEPGIEQSVGRYEGQERRRFRHAWRIAARGTEVLAIERIRVRLLIVRRMGK